MYFVDYERTIKKFLSPKTMFSATEFMRDKGRESYKRYSFEYMGLVFEYFNEGKNNDVIVRGDIPNFKHLSLNNMYGITFDKSGLCHISTREGLLLALIALSREDKEKGIGTYEQINASIIGGILAETEPFVSNTEVKDRFGLGNFRFDDLQIRNALDIFDDAVNPYSRMSPSVVDATNYPPNLSINGSKNNTSSTITIMDLKTKSSTNYTIGSAGFTYRLNSIIPSENRRLEVTHDYKKKTGIELVIIRYWDKKNKIFDVIYDVTNNKFGRLIDDKANYNYTDATEGEIDLVSSVLMNEATDYALDVTSSISNKASRARI